MTWRVTRSSYRDMVADYGIYFKGSMGAEAIQARLRSFDLEAEASALAEIVENALASARPAPSSASRSSTPSA